jgi:NADPH:quinone reductase-like Zn-dependent oxidoreductase
MKAIVYTRHGPPEVLRFQEVATPAPADHEVLIELCAASVNPLDRGVLGGVPAFARLIVSLMFRAPMPKPKVFGFDSEGRPERILGSDIAGRVEAVGKQVTEFQPGDEVFGGNLFTGGGFAEYVCADEAKLARKPANISFEEAAATPIAGITALQGLRDRGRIERGHKVLVDGASGGVGTFAVQIAKAFGAEATAVCSTRNLDTARSIGADHAIDYTREDFTKSGQRYDLILGANAYHSLFEYRRALTPDGIFVWAGGKVSLAVLLLGPLLSLMGRKKIRTFLGKMNREDLVFLKDLLEAGKVVPVIDRCYPLRDTAEALRYLAEGHARGKIVLTAEPSGKSSGVPAPSHSE